MQPSTSASIAQRTVADYILQVAAAASHDPEFVEDAKLALAPVDATREAKATRAAGAPTPPVDPDTPLPPELAA